MKIVNRKCYWKKRQMSYFFQIWTKEDFLSLFGKICIGIHVTLERSIISLNQVITQFIC